jgi:hypothetical protein
MLRAADAVFCATDSVSHDKGYVLLESSGLSTFACAIESEAQ